MGVKPKLKDVKDSEVIEDPEEIEIQEDYFKDTKFTQLLNQFKGSDDEFTCTIYRVGERNKRILVDVIDNEIPDPIKDLRDKHGGGKFRIYIHNPDKVLIDSADVNIEERTIETKTPERSRRDILEELQMMSSMFQKEEKDNSKDTEILLKLMDMQTKQSERVIQMQMESEQRMQSLILEIQSKKSSLQEIAEIMTFIEGIKSDAQSEPQGTVEKILQHPITQSFLPMLMQNNTSPLPQTPNVPKELPVPKQTKTPSIEEYVNSLPIAFKEKVTKENANKFIKQLHEKNKNKIDKVQAETIINIVLAEKGEV